MARRRRRRKGIPPRARLIAALAAVVASAALVMTSCRTSPTPPFERPPLADTPRTEPTMRIRIATAQTSVRFDAPNEVQVALWQRGSQAVPQWHTFATPLIVSRREGRFILAGSGSAPMGWQADALMVRSNAPTLSLNGTSYPGQVALHAGGAAALDAVNHVAMEMYLPGVIERELYSNWHYQAFVVQAIAARSYAIAESARTRNRHFDLESTTTSQVYGGAARNSRAIEAVRQTRGVVLTWQDYVLPAYYSSCCGGTSQDAGAAFPNAQTIPPLSAANRGNWCSNSASFRWGPITHDRDVLTRRLAAWGQANSHPIAQLRRIADIGVSARNSAGRPTAFRVQDASGTAFSLNPEHFRFACNYKHPSLPDHARNTELKSSHVTVALSGRNVVFSDGRGHGHGVGMCQHGTQALALQNYDAPSILNFYYPQATLKRIYP